MTPKRFLIEIRMIDTAPLPMPTYFKSLAKFDDQQEAENYIDKLEKHKDHILLSQEKKRRSFHNI